MTSAATGLPVTIKYHSQMEGIQALGGTERAPATFIGFQRELYSESPGS